jgi:hypothetical protein
MDSLLCPSTHRYVKLSLRIQMLKKVQAMLGGEGADRRRVDRKIRGECKVVRWIEYANAKQESGKESSGTFIWCYEL